MRRGLFAKVKKMNGVSTHDVSREMVHDNVQGIHKSSQNDSASKNTENMKQRRMLAARVHFKEQ